MSQINEDIRDAIEAVVAQHLIVRLQSVYSSLQNDIGATGDVAPWEIDLFEEAERKFARFISHWMVGNMSFDRAEALGMDGTLRS